MKRYEKNTHISNLKFDKTTFWVQVHDISIRYMNVQAAEKICEVLGIVHHSTDSSLMENLGKLQI